MADEKKKKMNRTELLKKLTSTVPLLAHFGVEDVTVSSADTTVSLNVKLAGVTPEQVKSVVDLINSKL